MSFFKKRSTQKQFWIFVGGLIVSLQIGCGSYLGNLRRDIDEIDPYSSAGPTVGGKYSEFGYLSDDEERPGGGRFLASDGSSIPASRRSWVSPEQLETARRNQMRGRLIEDEEKDEMVPPDYNRMPNLPPGVKKQYRGRMTKSDFIDREQNEGSLWAGDGQSNFFFSKNKIRGVGDILTIQVEPGLVKDISTEVARTLNEAEREKELMLAQERIRAQTLGLPEPKSLEGEDQVASSSSAPDRTPASGGNLTNQQVPGSTEDTKNKDVKIPEATLADINVGKSLAIKSGDTILAEIIERYPNGNYKVRGTKRIRYQNGFRLIQVLGVVKGSDITEEDTVSSGKLYEYRLEAYR